MAFKQVHNDNITLLNKIGDTGIGRGDTWQLSGLNFNWIKIAKHYDNCRFLHDISELQPFSSF